ncbi:DUF58 domain-containing protein [Ruania suaedae]|uniref:DUF58 domain-containing protein n=1 Tax=Ruania suaedae TaxID=2897774 RepID=UPI001E5279CD|nr:DUF58 domain-containing protein [Ruania suaedae]UFU04221.1 DUF58 domain-containing protein [Ruania suaedae]
MRPTARGAGLLIAGAGLAFLASAMRSPEIATLAALALTAPVVSIVWLVGRRIIGPRPDLVRTIEPRRPHAGDLVQVQLGAGSRGSDAWTSLRERIPAGMNRESTTANGYLMRPPVRGVYSIGPAVIVRNDPLRLARSRYAAPGRDDLIVWPALTDLSGLVRAWADRLSAHAAAGRPDRTPDDLTLREYRPGDDLRRVHWRASARHGELLTRQDEPTQDQVAALVLDVGPAEPSGPATGTEWLVGAAASMTVAMIEYGFRVRTTATWSRAGGTVATDSVTIADTATALDVFARAQHPASTAALPSESGAALCLAALRAPSPETATALSAWTGRRMALLTDDRHDAATILAGAGWAVRVAGPGTAADDAWADLLGSHA